jgi:hypothetical protein
MNSNYRVFIQAFIFLFLYAASGFSQTNRLKEYSIQGLNCGITKTSDQGVAVVYENAHIHYLMKMDSLLNVSWTKQLNLPVTASPVNIIETTDHGLLISFYYPNGGSFRTLLIKTSAQGNVLWSYYYERNWPVNPVGIVATALNGAVIVNNDFSIFEIDSVGNVLTSAKCFGAPSLSASSLVALNGEYYIYGNSVTSGMDVLILTKLNSTLQIDWTMKYDGNFPELYSTCMQSGLNNNLILAAYIPEGYEDTTLIISVDLNGNVLWGKMYNDLGTTIFSIHADNSGEYILGGLLTDSTYKFSKDVLIRIHDDGTFNDAFCTGNSYASGNGLEYIDEIINGYNNNDYYVLSSNFILKSTFEQYPLCYSSVLNYTASAATFSATSANHTIMNEPLTPVAVNVNAVSASLPQVVCNNVGMAENNISSSVEIKYFSNDQRLEINSSNTIHKGSVDILDFLGREVVHYPLHEEFTKTISCSDFPAGIYILQIQADAEYKAVKILKE